MVFSSIHFLISANTRLAASSGSPCTNEWYIPSYNFNVLSSLDAFSYNILDPLGHVTSSDVPCNAIKGALTLSKLFCMKSVHLTTSLIVPTLCFPKYRCGFTAIIFSFSGSRIAFTGPLPSGITAHESASPNNSPYMVICSLNKQQI
ncbi:hypothetical protein Hanom_Chr07g00584921 [Helianthus anomalus]